MIINVFALVYFMVLKILIRSITKGFSRLREWAEDEGVITENTSENPVITNQNSTVITKKTSVSDSLTHNNEEFEEIDEDENDDNYQNDSNYSFDSTKKELHDLWQYMKFKENSQAFYLDNVVSFDEWVSMDEIRRRIKELYFVNYKNERSLYPYIKTMVDMGLFEISDAGGKRQWRKKPFFIELNKINEVEEKIMAANSSSLKTKKKVRKKISE